MPDFANPQDLNRYSYVRNNAVRFTDPTGHLSLDEIEKYFGYSSDEKDRMIEDWGEGVANRLWDTDFTWGNVLNYNESSAMLVLFTNENSNTYWGGFWGIEGESRANPVSSYAFRSVTTTSENEELTAKYKDLGWENLPKAMVGQGYDAHYQLYTTTYVDVGMLNHAAVGVSITSGGWELLAALNVVPKPPTAIPIVLGVTGGIAAIAALSDAWLGTTYLDNFHNDYPVIRPWRSMGYADRTYHPFPPR